MNLEIQCSYCNGEGRKKNIAKIEKIERYKNYSDGFLVKNKKAAIERLELTMPDYIECPKCNGLGGTPTPEGQMILDFVKRHLRLDTFHFDSFSEVAEEY